jgi:hypothetical protein
MQLQISPEQVNYSLRFIKKMKHLPSLEKLNATILQHFFFNVKQICGFFKKFEIFLCVFIKKERIKPPLPMPINSGCIG